MTSLVVSKSFDNYVEIFLQNDREGEQHLEKAAGNFCNMLEAQEAAKAEYQDVTGKVHGFNQLWADRTGKTIGTIEQYNHLAKHSAELRKNLTEVKISALTKHFLSAYAASSPEAQERTVERLEAGVTVTPKHIRGFNEGRDIDAEEDVKQTLQRVKPVIEAKPTDVTERTYFEQSVGDDGYYAILSNAATLLFDDMQISTYSDDRLEEIIINEVNGNALMKRAGFRPFPEDQREHLRKLKEGIARLNRIVSRIELEPTLKAVQGGTI